MSSKMIRGLSIIILYILVLATLSMVIYLMVERKQTDKFDPLYMLATNNDKVLPSFTSPSVVSVLKEMGISCENNSVSFTVPMNATSINASGTISSNTTVSAPEVIGTTNVTGGTLNFGTALKGNTGAVANIDGIVCDSITSKTLPVKPGTASFSNLYVSGQSGLNGVTATQLTTPWLNGTTVSWCGHGIEDRGGNYLHQGPC